MGDSIVAQTQSSGQPTLAQHQESTQKALDNLARVAGQYGGIDYVPASLPEIQEALRIGKGNSAAVEQLIQDHDTAAQIGRGVRMGGPVADATMAPVPDSGAADQTVVITGDASGPRAARIAATTGGAVAGMFQSMGDGIVGLASLVQDGLAAQQYMLLGGDTDLNRSLPGYAARRQGFETFGTIAEGVKLIASDPAKFFGEAAGTTFDGIQSALSTAQDTHELSDWFLYGAKVGHATMDIAGMVGGVAALPTLAASAAGLAVNGVRATAQWLAPKVGAMAEGYMARTGGLLYAAPSIRTVSLGDGATTFLVDDAAGQILRAEGTITGPHPGRGKGYLPEPLGGRLSGEHRGHLIPEGGVENPSLVNRPENLISEAPSSNLGLKKSFDLQASSFAAANPQSVVTYVAEPQYRLGNSRPFAVTYYLNQDGVPVRGLSILNR